MNETNTMPTNFQLIRELKKTYGSRTHTLGFLTDEEAEEISKTLRLKEMNILALRNLRDLTVAIWADHDQDRNDESFKKMDEISAITYMIDMQIVSLGGEV